MKFSIWPDHVRPYHDTLKIVQLCEQLGWHAAYVADHFMPNGSDATPLRGNVLEALTTLTALGAQTSTIRLGTLVASATYRHPAVFAKAFTALDQISGGRAIVGIGAGWQENEHASYGIELGTIGERISRFEEYVAIVHSLLENDTTTFSGTYYSLLDAPNDPRPVQVPPPILLGVRGEKRTMRLAARYAALWNAWTGPADLARLNGVLDALCDEIGRDPAEIGRTTQGMVLVSTDEEWLQPHRGHAPDRPMVVGTPDEAVERFAEYRDARCDEFIVPTWMLGETERVLDVISLIDAEVRPHL
jgi:F420-dependent oxidoreductase-like protein